MVSIDTVYQRVLTIANKEQRGYISPQEFNLLANQAQLEIFEQYFYDTSQFGRVLGNDTAHSDMLNLLEEKISIFEVSRPDTQATLSNYAGGRFVLPPNLWRLGTVMADDIEAEYISLKEWSYIRRNPLAMPYNNNPIYYRDSRGISVWGKSSTTGSVSEITTGVSCDFIRRPSVVNWNYTEINGTPLYNQSNSTDFELHPSEEIRLVMKILLLAGVTINETALYQIASTEDKQKEQQQKL
tara:strand:+ start:298 stop:1020 length:723 start_codon:yes stop_codon:yes gene_type:complete